MFKFLAVLVFVPSLAAAEVNWRIAPPLADQEESTNLSGAACAQPPTACLLIGDEMRYAREFSISGEVLVPGSEVHLLDKEAFKETDAEGVAYENGFYYLAGSHGLTKPKTDKDGKKIHDGVVQESRFFVFRIPTDPSTGRPAIRQVGKTPAPEVVRRDDLRKILKETPPFAAFAEQPLAANGVNIEGLAIKNGDLYFGFRGPVVDGKAQVLKVSSARIFGTPGAHPAPTPYSLNLDGAGVRDIAAVRDGFLLLGGPSAPEPKPGDKGAIYFWKGDATHPVCLRSVTYSATDKPEVLLVLKDEPGARQVLVMSDEPEGGNPKMYDLTGGSCSSN